MPARNFRPCTEYKVGDRKANIVHAVQHTKYAMKSGTPTERYKSVKIRMSLTTRNASRLEPLMNTDLDDPEELLQRAVRSNIGASVENLRHGSEILESLIDKEKLLIVGAEYCLDSGAVDFFEGSI